MKKNTQAVAACFLLFAFVILNVGPAKAQSTSKEVFEKAIITEFCDTFSKASSGLNKDNMTAQLGFMILPLFTKYQTQIEREWSLQTDKAEDVNAIGEKIGQLASMNCQSFQNFIKDNLKDITEEQQEDKLKTYSGKLLRLEGTPFTYLLVQNTQGRTEKFYWMEFFPGAETVGTYTKASSNKLLRITYREMEVYLAATKDYRTIKVITKIDF